MKKVLIIFLTAIFSIVLVSCNNTAVVGNEAKENSKTVSSDNYVLEEIENIEAIPLEFRKDFGELAKQRGYKLIQTGEQEYLLFIALGEKSTAGYDVILKGITEENDKLTIAIEEQKPAEMAAQVISYPSKAFWLKGDIKDISNINVTDNNGKFLVPIDNTGITATAEYIGKTDSNSIELAIDGEPRNFQIIEIKEKYNELNLNKGEQVEVIYTENTNGQLIIKAISRLTSLNEPFKVVEGTYTGQIDSHSIEVSINGEAMVFQILEVNDEFQSLGLNEGDQVRITYVVDKNNVNMIKSITKSN